MTLLRFNGGTMGPKAEVRLDEAGSPLHISPDHYSPRACGNCHTDGAPTLDDTYRTPQSFLDINQFPIDEFFPSPSDCSAETFWPENLRNPQSSLQNNPRLRSQEYLKTLIASRKGHFPLPMQDASLEFYFGLKGDVPFPQQVQGKSVGLATNAEICAGPLKADGSCAGWKLDIQNEDLGIRLNNQEIISARSLEGEARGRWWKIVPGALLPGVQIKGISTREGRLLLGLKLSDPMLNAVTSALPGPLSPSPLDPDLHELDLTKMIFQSLPVAHDPQAGIIYSQADYDAIVQSKNSPLAEYISGFLPDPATLKVFPYFLQLAREGRIPDRLSINLLYESILEWLKARPKPQTQQEPVWKKWLPLFGSLLLKANLRPENFTGLGMHAEFSPDMGKNQISAQVQTDDFHRFNAYILAPLKLSRIFIPNALDALEFQGTLELRANQDELEFQVHDLALQLGPMDYPGNISILGARVRQLPSSDIGTPELPALRVKGNPTDGFQVNLNIELDNWDLRLPLLGKISLSGELSLGLFLKPEEIWEENSQGQMVATRRFRIRPDSVNVGIKNGFLAREDKVIYQDVEVQIKSNETLGFNADQKESFLELNLSARRTSDNMPVTLQAGLPIPKSPEGLLDFKDLLSSLELQAILDLGDGPQARKWNLSLIGKPDTNQPATQRYQLKVDGPDLANGQGGLSIQELEATLLREMDSGISRTELSLGASQLAWGGLMLQKPKLEFSIDTFVNDQGARVWEIPHLAFSANQKDKASGILQGAVWLKSYASARNPTRIEWNGATSDLSIAKLKLEFGGKKITPSNLLKATRSKISSFDIDGVLSTDWKVNLKTFRGKGLISLRGDNEGDIHLRDARGRRLEKPDPRDPAYLVETPMFANTIWTMSRMTGVDVAKQRINGNFSLQTDLDPAIARIYGVIIAAGKVVLFKENHDHMPYSRHGFTSKAEEYLQKKLQERSRGEP